MAADIPHLLLSAPCPTGLNRRLCRGDAIVPGNLNFLFAHRISNRLGPLRGFTADHDLLDHLGGLGHHGLLASLAHLDTRSSNEPAPGVPLSRGRRLSTVTRSSRRVITCSV